MQCCLLLSLSLSFILAFWVCTFPFFCWRTGLRLVVLFWKHGKWAKVRQVFEADRTEFCRQCRLVKVTVPNNISQGRFSRAKLNSEEDIVLLCLFMNMYLAHVNFCQLARLANQVAQVIQEYLLLFAVIIINNAITYIERLETAWLCTHGQIGQKLSHSLESQFIAT